jgi:hypothetical protein
MKTNNFIEQTLLFPAKIIIFYLHYRSHSLLSNPMKQSLHEPRFMGLISQSVNCKQLLILTNSTITLPHKIIPKFFRFASTFSFFYFLLISIIIFFPLLFFLLFFPFLYLSHYLFLQLSHSPHLIH